MTQFNPIEEMTLEGFQIVSSNMFIHLPRKSDATCTIWPTRISFSKLALEYLHFCEYIKLQVNPKTKCLLVMPVTSTDRDSIRWAKGDRFHDLRHSCASLLFSQGVSLKEIQAWLGHSTIGTTANIYTHLDENNKLSSAKAILSILPGK